jgi:hypothetical protein
MNMQLLNENKILIFWLTIILGFVLVFVKYSDSKTTRKADNLSSRATVGSYSMKQEFNGEFVREMKDSLEKIEVILSTQLPEMQKSIKRNQGDISVVRGLLDEFGRSEITDNSNIIEQKRIDDDPDYQQDQESVEAEERQIAYMNVLDDIFASQDEDDAWTAQVESEFLTAFESYENQVQLSDISCGSVMCKINANIMQNNDASGEEMLQLDHILLNDLKWKGQSVYEMDEATGEVTFYLMRGDVEFSEGSI